MSTRRKVRVQRQVIGAEGKLGDEVGPIYVHESQEVKQQVTGAQGRRDDEIGPIQYFDRGPCRGRLR